MKKFPILSKIKSLNDSLSAYQKKIYTAYYANVALTTGYFVLDWASGFNVNNCYVVIQQSYNANNVVGCTFTIQPRTQNIVVYVRAPQYTNGMPPDDSIVSFYIHYIKP